jgi:hypothetical protein
MRRLPPLLALLVTPVVAASAQNTPPPQAHRVVEWRTAPTESGAWRAGMAELVKMAQASKSPVPFFVFSSENRTVVARPVARDAILANPNQHIMDAQPDAFRTWIAGRPQTQQQVRNEIWVEAPDWTYLPANLPATTGISASHVQIAPGKGAAFDTARRDFVKFRQKVGYPYPVRAYRVVIGEPRIVFVTSFDSREAFFGTHRFAAYVEKAGAQAEWDALAARLGGTMGMEWDVRLWNFNAAASYTPQP